MRGTSCHDGRVTILVTGATGNVGGSLVAALVAAGRPVRAVVRNAESARRLPDGAEAVFGDLNEPSTFTAGLAGATGLFLLSGYAGTDKLLAAAHDAGVGHVVLLSSSSVVGTDTDNAVAAYHLAAEADVERSGIAATFLRPNSFMTNALGWRDQLAAGDVVRVRFPEVPISTIDPRDIADVAVASFGSGRSGALRLTGPVALTPAEQVAILAAAVGRPLHAHGLTAQETHNELHASMPAPYAEAIEGFFARGVIDETTVTTTVQDVLGRAPRTFEGWVADNRAAFAG